MQIDRTEVGFTGLVSVGRFAFFIYLSDTGFHMDEQQLAEQAIHFPVIVIQDDKLKQREEIVTLIKHIRKDKPNIEIIISSDGIQRPVAISGIDNIDYHVYLQLKNSGLEYKDRIKEKVINWYVTAGAKFIFKITNKDDVDEMDVLIMELGINKSQVYLYPSIDSDFCLKIAKQCGYNIAPDFRLLFNKQKQEGDEINGN